MGASIQLNLAADLPALNIYKRPGQRGIQGPCLPGAGDLRHRYTIGQVNK